MALPTRTAIVAAVLFVAGALATASSPGFALGSQETPVLLSNAPGPDAVPVQAPTPQEAAMLHKLAAIPAATQSVEQVKVASDTPEFDTLTEAVAAQDMPASPDEELNCLAIGVYYEAKGEPLAGQLAVADVLINRAQSGRFPRSICSVLTQPGQFSFVRSGRLPHAPGGSAWAKAMAVAQVAQKDLWDSPVPEALYFHARRVSPGWHMIKVGAVGNHVFYR